MKTRLLGLSILYLGCFFKALAMDLAIPTQEQHVAILGTGYHQEQERFVGQCLKGESVYEGMPQSNIDLTSSVSLEQLSSELGFSLGGRYQYGLVNLSASAKFMKKSSSSRYSISTIYVGSYSFKNRIL